MMSRTILCSVKINNVNTVTSARRYLSYRGVKAAVKGFFMPPSYRPPYSHVCQVGEPTLRASTHPVDPDIIETPEFQRLIKHMTDVMRTYNAMGLTAPQIGLCYQIIILELTEKHLESFDVRQRETRQVELIPLQVFINPTMKIIDYATIKHPEECASVLGYSAVVPRAKTVEISALNGSGKPFVWKADGWSARIAQHEMDHLQGKLYIDRMDTTTFSCQFWKVINDKSGYTKLQYYPKSWYNRYF